MTCQAVQVRTLQASKIQTPLRLFILLSSRSRLSEKTMHFCTLYFYFPSLFLLSIIITYLCTCMAVQKRNPRFKFSVCLLASIFPTCVRSAVSFFVVVGHSFAYPARVFEIFRRMHHRSSSALFFVLAKHACMYVGFWMDWI